MNEQEKKKRERERERARERDRDIILIPVLNRNGFQRNACQGRGKHRNM